MSAERPTRPHRRQQSRRAQYLNRRALSRWLLPLGMLSALTLGAAQARTIKIITADSLELRNIDDQELVVIAGENVELHVDDDVVKATRVEFNRTRRTLTLVGAATYHTAKDGQDLTGNDLVIDLGSEALTGQDVLISDSSLEIRGQEVERVPGQLRAQNGYFTPCAKCGRTPNDYAFRAKRIIVFPGDRLIAYEAQLLLADHPVMYLPVVVLPLNDEARQPKLQVSNDPVDGYTVLADLPFSIGSSVLGTTLLRYYQNRDPRFGGGVDLRAYAPARWIDRANLYFLGLPKPLTYDGKVQEGTDYDLNFSVKGRVPVSYALRDLDYTLNVTRKDIGRLESDKDRGVTNIDFGAKVEFTTFSAAFNYLNRLGPEPTTAINAPYQKTEVVVDPKPFTIGAVNADFKVTAGEYTAATNPASKYATDGEKPRNNFTTTRLEEEHKLSYTGNLGHEIEVQLTNSFVGRYYGTGGRTVKLDLSGQVTKRWAGGNSFSVRQDYIRYEGTSPFAFDSIGTRRTLSAPLTLTLNTVPASGATFNVTYKRDHFLQPFATERPETLSFSAGVNRKPVSASYSLDYNFATGDLNNLNYSVTLGDPDSGKLKLVAAAPAVPATPTAPAKPARPAYYQRSSAWPFPSLTLTATGGYSRTGVGVLPLTVKATVNGDFRTNYFSVSGTYDFQDDPYQTDPAKLNRNLISLGLDYNLVYPVDSVLNPVTVNGRETLALRSPRITGSHTLTWRSKYSFSATHDLALEQPEGVKESGTVKFSVGSVAGSATNWQLAYGGPYDLRRQGFTRPQLTGTLTTSQPGRRLSAAAAVNLPGLDQQRSELVQANLDGAWQQGRFFIGGRTSFTRYRSGTYPDDIAEDTLTLSPLNFGVGLGKGPKPSVYLTASFQKTLKWKDGELQNPDDPLRPIMVLTIDRCCWAMQATADFTLKRYTFSIGLPGQYYPLFRKDEEGYQVPLLPFGK